MGKIKSLGSTHGTLKDFLCQENGICPVLCSLTDSLNASERIGEQSGGGAANDLSLAFGRGWEK